MKTAIVILNWNGKKYMEQFLPGLIKSIDGRTDAEIIIADNASSDGSVEWLKTAYPSIRTIIFDKNYGFTGGYNKALKKIKAQYFLLLNSDIEVTDGWLEPLEEWMDNHCLCGACAPKLHSLQEREKFEYAGAAGGYIDRYGYPFCRGRVMKHLEKDYGQYDDAEDVMWVSGACLMIKEGLFKRLGGLDERFFAHMEEIDLCWRVQLEGYNVTVVPDSMVYHLGGGSLPMNSPWKLFLNYRNNMLMLKKNLATTKALEYYQDGEEASDAAEMGIRQASKILKTREFLDVLSAIAYLVTFKWKYFKSVLKARKEYKNMGHKPNADVIEGYLKSKGKRVEVKGIYDKSIIIESFRHGKDIFKRIKTEMM